MTRLSDIPTPTVNRIVGTSDFYFLACWHTVGMTNMKAIGARVRALRKGQPDKVTQNDLAEIIGVSRSTIAGIEAGSDRGGIETMIAIADHFKVPLDWLVCRTPPEDGPLVGNFVDDPDKLAWLAFWDKVAPGDRPALFSILQIAKPDRRTG